MKLPNAKYYADLQIVQKAENSSLPVFRADSSILTGKFLIDLIGSSAQEHAYVFYFDVHNKLLGYAEVAKGGDDNCIVSVKIIMQHALLCGAHGLIFAHNHPTGEIEPSNSDLKFTKHLKKASKLLDLVLMDALVIGNSGYYSFAEHSLLK